MKRNGIIFGFFVLVAAIVGYGWLIRNDTAMVIMQMDRANVKINSDGIRDELVDFGFAVANRGAKDIDTIIVHSSYNASGGDAYSTERVIDQWEAYGVAPHYMIDRNGMIYRLVKDKDIAYHAGVSTVPDGRRNVNDFSIGVEILNTKTDRYTDAQYDAVKRLIAFLKGNASIKYVLGHDDIAPDRKTDPWNFDWERVKKEL
jgi:AmpD protein